MIGLLTFPPDWSAELPRDVAGAIVHAFRIPLVAGDATLAAARNQLSPDESARADRFLDSTVGHRFTLARASLRTLLGLYLNCAPDSLEFTYGEKGKPGSARADAAGIAFNLSHSGDRAVIALAGCAQLGVDVEHARQRTDEAKLAARYFADAERTAIEALPEAKRAAAFYAVWTRKEAYMKAVGDGFSIPLKSFQVQVDPDAEAKLLAVESDSEEAGRWALRDIPIPEPYRACVAADKNIVSLIDYDVEWSSKGTGP